MTKKFVMTFLSVNKLSACLCLSVILTMKSRFSTSNMGTFANNSVYFKTKKELNYNRFVDPNILGASRLVHLDRRIYRMSYFLLDISIDVG